jgi:hypothetical protein
VAPDESDPGATDMTEMATTSTSIAGTLRGYSIEVNPNEP